MKHEGWSGAAGGIPDGMLTVARPPHRNKSWLWLHLQAGGPGERSLSKIEGQKLGRTKRDGEPDVHQVKAADAQLLSVTRC